MATRAQVLDDFSTLSDKEKVDVARVISIGPPPPAYVGLLWLIVVVGFVLLLLGGAFLLYQLVLADKETAVIASLVTGALGVLAGLLAPSPVQSSKL